MVRPVEATEEALLAGACTDVEGVADFCADAAAAPDVVCLLVAAGGGVRNDGGFGSPEAPVALDG